MCLFYHLSVFFPVIWVLFLLVYLHNRFSFCLSVFLSFCLSICFSCCLSVYFLLSLFQLLLHSHSFNVLFHIVSYFPLILSIVFSSLEADTLSYVVHLSHSNYFYHSISSLLQFFSIIFIISCPFSLTTFPMPICTICFSPYLHHLAQTITLPTTPPCLHHLAHITTLPKKPCPYYHLSLTTSPLTPLSSSFLHHLAKTI